MRLSSCKQECPPAQRPGCSAAESSGCGVERCQGKALLVRPKHKARNALLAKKEQGSRAARRITHGTASGGTTGRRQAKHGDHE